MKKNIFCFLTFVFCLSSLTANAQEAMKTLDKTAAIVGNKGGVQANFSITGGKLGSTSGTIAIKGSKFCARTDKATMWYNGKTQWTYMKKSNEVNISKPKSSQQQKMNPLTFIRLYKKGYKLSETREGSAHVVHMTATGSSAIPEIYVSVDASYTPTKVRMRQGSTWTTILISNFQQKKLPDSMFSFNSKDYPKAEIIDLR